MSYKLYTDKQEVFECDVAVKNASLKNSIARLVVESDDLNLVFKGRIEDGKCVVPIRKLKGLLEESSKGNMHLEIVVEDTYFKPWESEFVVEEHTSVKVQIKEQTTTSSKPILTVTPPVKSTPPAAPVKKIPSITESNILIARDLKSICEQFGVTKKNYSGQRRSDFKQIVREYFKQNVEFQSQMSPILKEVTTLLR